MTIPFWFNDPSILLNKKHVFVIWPNSFMTYEEKLNAITRLVVLLSICGYILTNSQNILITSLITIICIVMLHKMKLKDNSAILENLANEGFTGVETFEELKDNFEEYVYKTYTRLYPSAYKADLFRYCLMYIKGGCYFDNKYIPRVSLDNIIGENDKSLLCLDTIEDLMFNSLIIVIPKQEYFIDLIKNISFNVINNFLFLVCFFTKINTKIVKTAKI